LRFLEESQGPRETGNASTFIRILVKSVVVDNVTCEVIHVGGPGFKYGPGTWSSPVTRAAEIYVRLLGEGVDVWRPVRAEHVGGDVYRILSQPYDREIESWQFEPGDEVATALIEASDGPILAATSKSNRLEKSRDG
jgi:hypothetical protein